MQKHRKEMTEELLILAMELLTLLTGESYFIFKKFGDTVRYHKTPHRDSAMQAQGLTPSRSLTSERNNDKKHLEGINKIIELLTAEVPIRCQDVSVYFSMEEWEYIEGHKDLYKDVMAEKLKTSKEIVTIGNEQYPAILTDKDDLMEQILDLTWKTIFLLSGEKYILIKKPGDHPRDRNTLHLLGAEIKNHSPITESQHPSPISQNHQTILDVSNKIIELLTGEVPIRCQDAAVYFSMEEWEYLEGHKDLYKKDMQESPTISHPKFLSTDSKQIQNPIASQELGTSKDCRISRNKEQHIYSNPKKYAYNFHKTPETGDKSDLKRNEQSVSQKETTVGDTDRPFRIGHIGKASTRRALTSARNNFEHINMTSPVDNNQRSHKNCVSRKRTKKLNNEGIESGMVEVGVDNSNVFGNGQKTKPSNTFSALGNYLKQSVEIKTLALRVDKHFKATGKLDRGGFDFPENNYEETNNRSSLKSGKCFTTNKGGIIPNKVDKKQTRTCVQCGGQCNNEPLFEDGRPGSVQPICRKCFSLQSSLDEQGQIISKNSFSCSECHKYFSSKQALDRHERGHTDPSLYSKCFQCSECGKSFNQNSNLQAHIRTHTGEKPFFCSQCGRSFGDQSNFNKHLKWHSGVKNISCSECGKRFYRQRHLISHQLTHTGVKPFSCPECGKCFSTGSLLNKHVMIHSGQAPFQCSECSKTFCYASDLYKHHKTHTGQKPYRCSECGKGFITRVYLNEHLRTHTGEKPFVCVECGKGFATRSNFRKHTSIHKK